MHPMLNIADKAARRAGDIILRAFDRLDTIKVTEKSRNDYVTEVDKAAEQDIIETILKNYPDHAIQAEESGQRAGNEYTWIIDPLDGTHNFMHGFPHFAVSIAIKHGDKIEHGLIYDPVKQDIFSASKGAGAKLNNHRIRVAQSIGFEGTLLASGLPSYASRKLDIYMQTLHALAKEAGDCRRAGSAALDLAYVAAGRLDGYWEFGLQPWDIAAGSLMVKEAGGLVSDFAGQENYLKSGDILAANPKLFKKMLQIIKPIVEG